MFDKIKQITCSTLFVHQGNIHDYTNPMQYNIIIIGYVTLLHTALFMKVMGGTFEAEKKNLLISYGNL